jgi:16S rRNA (adenine1518-N6/adenine1519-N6)-dimethyltransferase
MSNLPSLTEIVRAHGLSAKKSLGQHFLLDSNITDRITRYVQNLAGSTILEVGPGPGGLTRSLLNAGAVHVVAIEFDPRAVAALSGLLTHYAGRLTLLHEDALAFDLASIEAPSLSIVSNLPYNIGTELLIRWLHAPKGRIAQMVLMFQKEVVDRLCAHPGSKAYGRLSILTQWLCDVERCFDLSPHAFVPPPAVDSTVVRLVPKATPIPLINPKMLETLTHQVFSMRRKTLRVSMKSLTPHSLAILAAANIDPERRPETLSVEEFCRLANALAA